jgi:hypothetical protein
LFAQEVYIDYVALSEPDADVLLHAIEASDRLIAPTPYSVKTVGLAAARLT